MAAKWAELCQKSCLPERNLQGEPDCVFELYLYSETSSIVRLTKCSKILKCNRISKWDKNGAASHVSPSSFLSSQRNNRTAAFTGTSMMSFTKGRSPENAFCLFRQKTVLLGDDVLTNAKPGRPLPS